MADGAPHLPRERDLTAAERERFHVLHPELIGLRDAVRRGVADSSVGGSIWAFESGPITIICPEVPAAGRSPLAREENPNYTQTHRYADLDALIELWVKSAPSIRICESRTGLSAEVDPDDLTGHLVVLGGIAWNQAADRLQRKLKDLPIQQVEVPDLKNGEIFRSSGPGGHEFRPRWEERGDAEQEAMDEDQIKAQQAEDAWRDGKRLELVEDVALLARLPNPYKHGGTLTICSGVYSRGVLGAVRALTDVAVRERNDAYIANRFPSGSFAMLMRVPVVNGKATAPDLEISENRLYEWPPDEDAAE